MKYTTEELILAALVRERAGEIFDVKYDDAKERGDDMDRWIKNHSPYDFVENATKDFEGVAEQIRQSRTK
ncbi:hypothetical protein [Comamonas sp. GB3 AK4-5]|uniref:hypothetical protein n=1 Tax=Comamonas sp. GB3 AK4-5 TaxID=3231487 RepID=UPI00351EB085